MSGRLNFYDWVKDTDPYFGEESTRDAWDYQEKRIKELEAKLRLRTIAKDGSIDYYKSERDELHAKLERVKALEPIFADTAVNKTVRVYRAKEVEEALK